MSKEMNEEMRCDVGRCPAGVKNYFIKGDLVLGFCSHHSFQYNNSLLEQQFEVIDHPQKGGVGDVCSKES